jgi:hypothetical protein
VYIIQWRRNNNVEQRADKAPQTDSEEVAITKALPRARRAGQGEEEEIDEARRAWIDRRGEVRALECEHGGFHVMQCSVLQQQRRQRGWRTDERTNGRPRLATSAYPAFFTACADDGDLTLRASTGWMFSSRMDDQVGFVDSLHTSVQFCCGGTGAPVFTVGSLGLQFLLWGRRLGCLGHHIYCWGSKLWLIYNDWMKCCSKNYVTGGYWFFFLFFSLFFVWRVLV